MKIKKLLLVILIFSLYGCVDAPFTEFTPEENVIDDASALTRTIFGDTGLIVTPIEVAGYLVINKPYTFSYDYNNEVPPNEDKYEIAITTWPSQASTSTVRRNTFTKTFTDVGNYRVSRRYILWNNAAGQYQRNYIHDYYQVVDPKINITPSTGSKVAGVGYTFKATSDYPHSAYSWTVSKGSTPVSYELIDDQSMKVVFPSTGTYTVTARVGTQISGTITVTVDAPYLNITVSPEHNYMVKNTTYKFTGENNFNGDVNFTVVNLTDPSLDAQVSRVGNTGTIGEVNPGIGGGIESGVIVGDKVTIGRNAVNVFFPYDGCDYKITATAVAPGNVTVTKEMTVRIYSDSVDVAYEKLSDRTFRFTVVSECHSGNEIFYFRILDFTNGPLIVSAGQILNRTFTYTFLENRDDLYSIWIVSSLSNITDWRADFYDGTIIPL